jgi:hypothetical protein
VVADDLDGSVELLPQVTRVGLANFLAQPLQVASPQQNRSRILTKRHLEAMCEVMYRRTALAFPVLGTRMARSQISLHREWLKGKNSTKRSRMAW